MSNFYVPMFVFAGVVMVAAVTILWILPRLIYFLQHRSEMRRRNRR